MSAYLLSVIGTVLICALLSIVLPEGKTSKMVFSASKVACVVAIVAPIPSLLSGSSMDFFGETSIETDVEFIKYCKELRIVEAQGTLEKELREKYGDGLTVTLFWGWDKQDGEEEIKVYRVDVAYQSLTESQKNEIYDFIYENYAVKTTFLAKGSV